MLNMITDTTVCYTDIAVGTLAIFLFLYFNVIQFLDVGTIWFLRRFDLKPQKYLYYSYKILSINFFHKIDLGLTKTCKMLIDKY